MILPSGIGDDRGKNPCSWVEPERSGADPNPADATSPSSMGFLCLVGPQSGLANEP